MWLGLSPIVVLIILLAGCASKPGVEGTWVYSTGGLTDTIVITPSTWSETYTSAIPGISGTMNATISNIDTGASHILMTVTSTSGIFSSYANGTVLYMTYSLNGSSLLISGQTGSYPASAAGGPYTRQ